jgi:hypothetical protein
VQIGEDQRVVDPRYVLRYFLRYYDRRRHAFSVAK